MPDPIANDLAPATNHTPVDPSPPALVRTGRSQHNEHEYILGFFANDKPEDLRVLDVGAADGVELSNTIDLIERGARAILIEASPYEFIALVKNMKPFGDAVTLVHAAIGEFENVFPWHDSSGGFVSTLSDSHKRLWQHDETANPSGVPFTTFYVPTVPLRKVLRAIPGGCEQFDFINIDTEGMNYLVASQLCDMIRSERVKPRLLCIETEPNVSGMEDALVVLLAGVGYEVRHKIDINLFFVPKEAPR